MRCVAILVLLLASYTACAAVGVAVPFTTVAKGASSGITQSAQVVVRNSTHWAVLWHRHTAQTLPPPPVDFSRDMVVALLLGEQPAAGYSIEVTRIERTGARLSIYYRTTRPDPGTTQTQVRTQPFHLIKLARTDDPLTFIRDSGTR